MREETAADAGIFAITGGNTKFARQEQPNGPSCPQRKNVLIMNNSDFWTSINTIVEEDFTPGGLSKLERYAEQIVSGQLLYKRFSPQEQHGCATGGPSHVIASLLAGAETEADTNAQGRSCFQRELQRGTQQAKRIERWAKAVGIWMENVDETQARRHPAAYHRGGVPLTIRQAPKNPH